MTTKEKKMPNVNYLFTRVAITILLSLITTALLIAKIGA